MVWRDLDRLENWADRNILKFKERNGNFCICGRMCIIVYWGHQFESSSTVKEFGITVDDKLPVSQHSIVMAEKTNSISRSVASWSMDQ